MSAAPQAMPLQQEPPIREMDGAWNVLRRALRGSPELRAGLGYTIALAMVSAAGSLLVPILIQQILDRGFRGPGGFRPEWVYTVCGLAAVVVSIVYLAGRATFRRMVAASETALKSLRVRTFEHIHDLSIAEHTATRRGIFVSRVTSDIDTLLQFMEWGALSWVTGSTLVLGTLVAMLAYSWRLTLIVVVVVAPLFFVLRMMQRGLLASYDTVRTRVSETLSEVSESVMGAAVIRAYGFEDRMDRRLKRAIGRQYDATIHANRYQAAIFPVSDVFGGFALAAVVAVGVSWGPGWGMTPGHLVAFLFLVNLFLQPLGEIAETFDQTQTAIAGWRKILGILDIPLEVADPKPGVELPPGPLAVGTEDVEFAYADGDGLVLRGIDVAVDAGAHVAIVGETGCGKTTFAKLLCRLADPINGRILVGGVDLREVSARSRRSAIRMVPQDGFLFDTSVIENVRLGREGASDADANESLAVLGLSDWVAGLPNGADTIVGERGENLSVGERQLVALARAQMARPGVLILDEATSAVDPETESMLAAALERLAEGRTTITIAHRLSTAEKADEVLVFDRGCLVETGDHASLVRRGGVYAALYQSWLGNTQPA